MPHKRILNQMFDVRPVKESGDLDWEKIEKIKKIVYIHYNHSADYSVEKPAYFRQKRASLLPQREDKKSAPFSISPGDKYLKGTCKKKKSFTEREFFVVRRRPKFKKAKLYQLNKTFSGEDLPVFQEVSSETLERINSKRAKETGTIETIRTVKKEVEADLTGKIQKPIIKKAPAICMSSKKSKEAIYDEEELEDIEEKFCFSDLFLPPRFSFGFNLKKVGYSFALASLSVMLVFLGASFLRKSSEVKERVLGVSTEGYENLETAVENVKEQDFEASSVDFHMAYEKFSRASRDLDEIGGSLMDFARFVPFASRLSSGRNMVEAGKHIALAGESLNDIIKTLSAVGSPLNEGNPTLSLLDIFQKTGENLKVVKQELGSAGENLDKVNIDDLPEDKRLQFLAVKEKLPPALAAISGFLDNSDIFIDLLGGNGPRKYLFLFQNNQEMRATGGFIGSYGVLDIYNGRVRNFFVDGIFNPDGQLKEKIVPPQPIQKISAAWSLHDSNWWPDFPASARKAIVFYEKTGGPTADGVITLTPAVMQKLLEVTGPVKMADYGVTLDAENFVQEIQAETEVNYDKELNQPKKILADLAPIILDRLFNANDLQSISRAIGVFSGGLNQKQILLYSQNAELQEIISRQGWSGEVLNTGKDYLSVINTNINGYKTDGVIDESIKHSAEIRPDGSVVDTVTITRKHNGGNTGYDWWNKVNADYMRVYVPKGSKLLETEGQTREFNDPPLDYDALGFNRDADVQKEEENMNVNKETGTRVYDEGEKTVFANWTYVSPQETVVIKYKYLLPFKISLDDPEKPANSYSLLAQKQAGSIGSKFNSEVKYPDNWKIEWQYPETSEEKDNEARTQLNLDIDQFIGLVFSRKNVISN